MPDLPGGPSEAAVEPGCRCRSGHPEDCDNGCSTSSTAFTANNWEAMVDVLRPFVAVGATTPRTSPMDERDKALAALEALGARVFWVGTDRSVNEAWCRADQTRRIVEWLREYGGPSSRGENPRRYGANMAAEAITREFGGGFDG